MKKVEREWLEAQCRDALQWQATLKKYLRFTYLSEAVYYLLSAVVVGCFWWIINLPDTSTFLVIFLSFSTFLTVVHTYFRVESLYEWRDEIKDEMFVDSFKIRLWQEHGEESQEKFMEEIRANYYFEYGLDEQEIDDRLKEYVDLINDRERHDYDY